MKNQTILMLGYSDWDHWRPAQELARLFARENTVIFVERLLSYSDLRWQGVGRSDCLKRLKFTPMRKVSKNLFVIQPPPGFPSLLPILSRFIDKYIKYFSNHFGKILQAQWLKTYLRRQGINPTVFFLNHPSDLHLTRCFDEQISCWYVYDELADAAVGTNYSELLKKIEHKNISKIDLVFASSREQYERRKNVHSSVFFMPNACSSDSIVSAIDDVLHEPQDIKDIPHPRIGYIGTIDSRIDFCLLEYLAVNNPDLSLVFIGWINSTAKDEMHKLMSYPNVFFLGEKTKDQVSGYVRKLDIGLIPFKINKTTNSMLPLKTFEYLACGLPVVATPLQELLPYSEVLNIAHDKLEFSDLIVQSMRNDSKEKDLKRVAVARENSWETRASKMGKLIFNELSQNS